MPPRLFPGPLPLVDAAFHDILSENRKAPPHDATRLRTSGFVQRFSAWLSRDDSIISKSEPKGYRKQTVETQEVPVVAGRHRTRAPAKRRKTRAVELVLNGCTYQQAAEQMGYANRGTVHRLVNEALAAQQ